MTAEKTNNKAIIGGILIALAPIIFLYGIIAFKIVANISYTNNTNINIVLFVIEHKTLLNVLFVVALLLCVVFGVAYSQATNQIPWFLMAIILIAFSLDVFAYKTPYVNLQEKENKIIQDLLEQGKITEESLIFLMAIILIAFSLDVFAYKTPYVNLQEKENKIIQDLLEQGKITEESLITGWFDEEIKPPAELAVCFDKEFEGELCSILFEKLLAEERIKIEARNEARKTAQATKEKQENKLSDNYSQLLQKTK